MAPVLPAMLTLTYPGDWLTVASDAATVKRHFWALCKRYERTWGEPLIGPWKLEFQRRGAPHVHISTTPRMGFTSFYDPDAGRLRSTDLRAWLSLTWAEIVAHPDPEQRRLHRRAGTGVTTRRASSSSTLAGWPCTSPSTERPTARSISTACHANGAALS
jgi:hypothetical protein